MLHRKLCLKVYLPMQTNFYARLKSCFIKRSINKLVQTSQISSSSKHNRLLSIFRLGKAAVNFLYSSQIIEEPSNYSGMNRSGGTAFDQAQINILSFAKQILNASGNFPDCQGSNFSP
jgi:hypothetical protein